MPTKPSVKKSRSRRPRRGKHIPQRTCVACRQVKSKREMIRLVRTPEGRLIVDETGKHNGRGAYLCRQSACWEVALGGQQLSRALNLAIGEPEKEMLGLFAHDLAAREIAARHLATPDGQESVSERTA